jgi:DNA-binding response OmpR family regulator
VSSPGKAVPKEPVIFCDGPMIAAMGIASEASTGITFGRFLLLPDRRELLADGRPVKLGGRAYDVLMALAAGTRDLR